MNPFDRDWILFTNEAHLIRSLYRSGFEELSRADLSSPGRYIASLYSIGMALERLGKLCYVIMSRRYGSNEKIDVKLDMGHNLRRILATTYKALGSGNNNAKAPNLSNGILSKTITLVEGVLGGKSRYFSIDCLTGREAVNPYPLLHQILEGYHHELLAERWAKAIYNRALSQAAELHAQPDSYSWSMDFQGKPLTQVELFTVHAVYAIGCRGLRCDLIELIKPLTEYLMDLELESGDYPYFSEFFLVFTNKAKISVNSTSMV